MDVEEPAQGIRGRAMHGSKVQVSGGRSKHEQSASLREAWKQVLVVNVQSTSGIGTFLR